MRLTILIVFIVISPALMAQKKGDNTIVVDTTINITKLKTYFFQNGYMLEGQDTSFITTSAKQINGAVIFKLNILKTDTSIFIKGQMKLTVEPRLLGQTIKQEFDQVYYVKSTGNFNWDCWQEMAKLAAYIGGSIKYLKQ